MSPKAEKYVWHPSENQVQEASNQVIITKEVSLDKVSLDKVSLDKSQNDHSLLFLEARQKKLFIVEDEPDN